MSDSKSMGHAQDVWFPLSAEPKWHFRRWSGVSALACNPAFTPDEIASDAVVYTCNDGSRPEDANPICPWCDYARRVYLEPGLSNPPEECWQYTTDGQHWQGFVINGTSTWRPPAGAQVRRSTPPAVLTPTAPSTKRWSDGEVTLVSRRLSADAKGAVDRWFLAHAEHCAAAERGRVLLQARIGITTDVLVDMLNNLQAAQMAEAHAMLETVAAHDELVALIRKTDADESKARGTVGDALGAAMLWTDSMTFRRAP